MAETVLVTGGAGYIGSHACVALLAAGRDVVVLDNLCNSRREVVSRVERIAGGSVAFIEGDVRDGALLDRVFAEHRIDAVMHFAGLKSVGESQALPLAYYDNNVVGSLRLVEAMARAGVGRLVFSSSATVYGEPAAVPVREEFPLAPTNPYGRSKLMVEELLADLHASDPARWQIASLRYFNPVGAHASGLIGEDPRGVPNNLMPYVCGVASGRYPFLSIFGDDYPTADGTGVRDFIHVVDLAAGHVKALEALAGGAGLITVNLGTGRGYSVREVVAAFEAACSRKLAVKIAPRRPGDVAVCFADPARAERVLGWRAELGLARMCEDAWRWASGAGLELAAKG